ncbi:MAG: hypothetical protein ABGY42_01035 [bacterium]
MAAAIAYLLVILWALSGLADNPARLLLLPAISVAVGNSFGNFIVTDQQMVLGTVMHAARGWLDPATSLMGAGACFPAPNAWTLGEHMFGPGLLAALPLAITGEPILAYNLMLVLTMWIPAFGTFVLARRLTGSTAAAFVAGLLAALTLPRLNDLVHPYVHGDLWIPAALVCLHQAFHRGGLTALLGLPLFCALTFLESYYAILGALIVLGTITLGLALQTGRAGLRRAAPALSMTLLATAATAWIVLGPYLESAATGHASNIRVPLFGFWSQILPGHSSFPGILLTSLAAIGALGYFFLPTNIRRKDPRLIYLLAAFLVWWSSTSGLPLGNGRLLTSPLRLLLGTLPGLDSVRLLAVLASAMTVPLAIVAAFGLSSLLAAWTPAGPGRGVLARGAVMVVLSALFLFERFDPAISQTVTGIVSDGPAAIDLAPPPAVARLLRQATGPVLGTSEGNANLEGRARAVLRTAWTEQASSACYNSLTTETQAAVTILAQRLPDRARIRALAALGFRNLLVDHDGLLPWNKSRMAPLAAGKLPPELRLIGREGSLALYEINAPTPTTHDWRVLRTADSNVDAELDGPVEFATIRFSIRNSSEKTFLLPGALEPQNFEARWINRRLDTESVFRVRLLPLLALGAGDRLQPTLKIPAGVPAGNYRVELVPEGQDHAIAKRIVNIR